MITFIDSNTHRNGVGGEPFVVVTFTHDSHDRPLIAVIPSKYNPREGLDFDNGWSETYVIDPTDLSRKWRGDQLYRELVEEGLWDRVTADARARDALLFTPEVMAILYPTGKETAP